MGNIADEMGNARLVRAFFFYDAPQPPPGTIA